MGSREMDNISEMSKQYKNLIISCIVLSTLFVGLVALPRNWSVKTGMTQREYEIALVEASDDMLTVQDKSERQIAMRRIQKLHKIGAAGEFGKVADMTWILNAIRFMLIVAILSLCWRISKTVYKGAAKLKSAKESSAAKS
jgi:hypothetical protein